VIGFMIQLTLITSIKVTISPQKPSSDFKNFQSLPGEILIRFIGVTPEKSLGSFLQKRWKQENYFYGVKEQGIKRPRSFSGLLGL
jgi:hypothetical protein